MQKSMLAVVLLVGACANKEAEQLLASDLVFEKTADGWTYEVVLDPRISRYPEIARLIMAEKTDGIIKPDNACDLSETGQPICSEAHDITVQFAGSRLVSLMDEILVDAGGAHPVMSYEGHTFDVSTKRQIQFSEIFTDWREAKSRMQQQFCRKLAEERPEAEKCPDIEKQGLALHQAGVVIQTHDYQLGFYALGRAIIVLDFDGDRHGREFLSLMKSEYRAQFPRAVQLPAYVPSAPEDAPKQSQYTKESYPTQRGNPSDAAAAASEAARLAVEAASATASEGQSKRQERDMADDYPALWSELKDE